jgi:hypothetical protein
MRFARLKELQQYEMTACRARGGDETRIPQCGAGSWGRERLVLTACDHTVSFLPVMMTIGKKLPSLLAVVAVTAVHAETVALKADRDNTLYEEASGALSNGSGDYLFAGSTLNGDLRRTLIRFNLSGIPAGSIITNVMLRLFMDRSIVDDQEMSLHGVLADWGEGASDAGAPGGAGAASAAGDATWIHRFYDDTPWGAAGGDYQAAASASQLVGGVGSYAWSSADMVRDAQSWLDTPDGNFGWILVGNEGVSPTAKRFLSREHPTIATQPLLTVGYSIPEPSPGWLVFLGFVALFLIRRQEMA